MQFWQGVIALSVLSAVFVFWPTLFTRGKQKKELRAGDNEEGLRSVFDQQVEDLEASMQRGEISAQELDTLKVDMEKTLIEDSDSGAFNTDAPIVSSFRSRLPVIALALLIPIASLIMYFDIGAKSDWEIYDLMLQPVSTLDEAKARAETLTQKLQVRTEQKPENAGNWYLLASTSMDMGQFDEAVRGYREVLRISPNSPRIMAELAQALFSRAGNTITPEVKELIYGALELAPMEPTALGLAGVDAYQSGNYQLAITHWKSATSRLDPNSSAYQALSAGVEIAEEALAQAGSTQVSDEGQGPETDGKPTISVKVSLDESVDADPAHTVFVYARAWKGPKMPLAIERLTVADLPTQVTLSQSMMEGMDLSSFPQVEVLARISPSGSPVPSPGDWQAAIGPVVVASQKDAVVLKIDTLVE